MSYTMSCFTHICVSVSLTTGLVKTHKTWQEVRQNPRVNERSGVTLFLRKKNNKLPKHVIFFYGNNFFWMISISKTSLIFLGYFRDLREKLSKEVITINQGRILHPKPNTTKHFTLCKYIQFNGTFGGLWNRYVPQLSTYLDSKRKMSPAFRFCSSILW